MGNVYRYTPLFFIRILSNFFLIYTHEYAKTKNLHINILNKKLCLGFSLVPRLVV